MNNKNLLNIKTINTIKKYISEEDAVRIKNKINSLDNNSVTVTNTGVVSSGKSSLYNALLDRQDDDRFSVGAARTTISKDIEKFADNIDLVDTPGIDVKDEDDEAALSAVCASSIIIMVHNIKMGMLHKNEVDWLKKIALNFNSKEEIKDRFIFVSSWMDERMQESSFESTLEETKRILFETMGTEVDFYSVSAKLYKMGMERNQLKFIEISNIPNLKKAIYDKAELYRQKYGATAVKKEVWNLSDQNSKKLTQIRYEKNQEKTEKSKDIINKYSAQTKEWSTVYKRYKDMYEQYEKINAQMDESQNGDGGSFFDFYH